MVVRRAAAGPNNRMGDVMDDVSLTTLRLMEELLGLVQLVAGNMRGLNPSVDIALDQKIAAVYERLDNLRHELTAKK